MNTCFETYVPAGDTEIVIVPQGLAITSAKAKVSSVCIVHGIECQPFERVEHDKIPEIRVTRPKWTDLPGLPSGEVLFKNSNPDAVLVRIRLQVQEQAETPPPVEKKSSPKKNTPPVEEKPQE